MIELIHLTLKRLALCNYKSIKRLELDNLNNVVLLMGRNNAGKSNILDAFKFLSEAAVSFEHALASRDRDVVELIHRKRAEETMEFLFDFVIAPQRRAELVRRLFTGNSQTSVADALNSDLLSILTLKISVSREHFEEELSTPNLEGSRPFVIFSIKGTTASVESSCGQLETFCKQHKGELPSELLPLEAKPEKIGPYRLRLGRPDAAAAWPVSCELAEAVFQQFACLEWADPMRKLPTSSPILGQQTLTADISNLPDVLHWLYNNKPKQFRRIETEVSKLVPNLGKLYTPTQQNQATLGMIDSSDEDLVYSMDQLSFGTRSLVAIIAKVVLARPGAWVCIEEPETYLHPSAQMELFHFLRDEGKSKRIFVATHSTAIAASCPLSSLFIVQRDAARCTIVTPVTPAEAGDVIEQLGVKPSFSFEADAIVFVEQAAHVPIFEAWARKFEFGVKIQFLDAEGAATLSYFANARIALSSFVHTLVFAVFGNGSELASRTRRKIIEQLELPEQQVFTLDFPELEGYLLDPAAILRAFPAITLPLAELEARLDPARTLPEQKKALADLLAEFHLGEYDGHLGARIAEAMTEIPASIRQLFEKIDLSSKPYWKI
ncbi:MAG: AAA family ATPase [Verrucomicrobiota bacterium]